mmetsp:Transcript_28822/g.41073  ORF Transcript_28822/g.41073 Transcript_28822/m.41073 type:complete len:107 (+) Transcript_28822:331-651(+)
MPFTVCQIDQSCEIGTFLLDSSTACGDILELGQHGLFKVKRVIFSYKYDGHKHRLVRKKLEVLRSYKGSKGTNNKKLIPSSLEAGMDTSIEDILLNADDQSPGYLQ